MVTYSPMPLPIRIPTNVEILHSTPENGSKCVTVQVPETGYWVVCEPQAHNLWKAFLLKPDRRDRLLIGENIRETALARLISAVLKKKPNVKEITDDSLLGYYQFVLGKLVN